MKIIAISDLHGYLPELEPCDLVLIAGDIVPLVLQKNMEGSIQWLNQDFRKWANELNCDKVIFIAGNHDFVMEREDRLVKTMFARYDKITYLKNELYTYTNGNSISIFGSPYCKIFGNWAFMREPDILTKKFSDIPEGVDILLTHDAPYGTSDIIMQKVYWNKGEHIGNKQLRDAIINSNPKYNIHGHLHSTNHGWETLNNTKVICCSIKDEYYEVAYEPLILEINE